MVLCVLVRQVSSADEGLLAERVMAMVKSQHLPLTIKNPTESDHNCFFRALIDLFQEPYFGHGLSDEVLSAASNHFQLRQAVVNFLERLDQEGDHDIFNNEKDNIIQAQRSYFTFMSEN